MQNKDERDCKYELPVLTDTSFFPHHPTSCGFTVSITKAMWNAHLCCITFIPLKKEKLHFHNTARVAANASTKEAAGVFGLVAETIVNLYTT